MASLDRSKAARLREAAGMLIEAPKDAAGGVLRIGSVQQPVLPAKEAALIPAAWKVGVLVDQKCHDLVAIFTQSKNMQEYQE